VVRACASVLAVSLVLGGSLLPLTGCGSSSSGPASNGEAKKTGAQIEKDAAAALASSGAAHLAGTLNAADSTGPVGINFHLQSDGSSGTLNSAGFPVNIVSVGGINYVKAPTGYWVAAKVPSAAAAKLGGRWVKVPTNSSFSDTSTLLSLPSFAASVSKLDPGVTINPKVTTTTLNGQQVVVVSQSDGSQVYVAATGKPYPLKIVSSGTGTKGVATLSGFGKTVALKAPAGAIDASAVSA
jgi:hypothetical protein